MTRPRALALALVIALGLTSWWAAPASADPEPSATPLGIQAVAGLLVDPAHGRALVTDGIGSLVSAPLDGGAVSTIGGLPGPSRLAMSADGARVYVLLPQGDAIDALDASTLAEVHRYPVPTGLCLSGLAVVGGQVWFGYGCSSAQSNLGLLDPVSGTVTLAKAHAGLFRGGPVLHAEGQVITAAVLGAAAAEGTLRVFDVSSGDAELTASRELGAPIEDWALSKDGSTVEVVTAKPAVVQAYATADLSPTATTDDAMSSVQSVALSSTGELAIGSTGKGGDHLMTLHRTDGSTGEPFSGGPVYVPGGSAFSDDGSAFVATQQDSLSASVSLLVDLLPDRTQTAIDVAVPATVRALSAFTVTGRLTSAAPLPAGLDITTHRTGQYDDAVDLPAVQTQADGTFSLTDTTPNRGVHTYTLSFAGTDALAPTTLTVSVTVLGALPVVTFLTHVGPYAYGAAVTAVIHLSTGAGHQVHVYQEYDHATLAHPRSSLISVTKTDSSGNARVKVTLTQRTEIRTVTDQDSVYDPVTNVGILHVLAKVTTTMLGNRAGRSGAHTLYHLGQQPALGVTILAPHVSRTGDCLGFVGQELVRGTWRTISTTACLRFSYASSIQAIDEDTHGVGAKLRYRTDFKGDFENTKASSPWAYAEIIA